MMNAPMTGKTTMTISIFILKVSSLLAFGTDSRQLGWLLMQHQM